MFDYSEEEHKKVHFSIVESLRTLQIQFLQNYASELCFLWIPALWVVDYRKQQQNGRRWIKRKQPTVTIETVNKIFHMKLNLIIYQTAKKIQKTTTMKEKKMWLYKTKRSSEKNITQSSTETRVILVTIQEQIRGNSRS